MRRFQNLLVLTVSLLLFTTTVFSADEFPYASPDVAWDSLFDRSDGWTGADVAGTIDLKDGRLLWVFGDTWIGRIENGKHLGGAQLVNNSAAIQPINAASADQPPKDLQFLVGRPTAEGATTWIADPEPPADATAKTWFWTTGGGTTVVRSGRPALYVFLFKVKKRTATESVWNFRVVGTTIAIFDDIRLPATEWKPRLIDIPHSFDVPGNPDRDNAQSLLWGMAALRDPDPKGSENVLIYGVRRESKQRNDLVLVKVGANDIETFDRWKFFVEADKWSTRLEDARSVVEDVPTELSVEQLRDGSQFVMIYSEPRLGTGIFLRTAARPEGPWSSRILVYRVQDKKDDRRFFAYAAKGHAILSHSDELLVTYVVNSHDFSLMVNDTSIYRPRFVKVKLP